MLWSIFLPVFLGAAGVLQGGVNRHVVNQWGISAAVMINTLFFIVAGLALYFATLKYPEYFPQNFPPKIDFSTWTWWYILPAIFGFCIVVGVPYALTRVSALNFFVALIGAQIVTSLLWDKFSDGIPLSGTRVAGAILAFLGAVLATWKK